MNISKQSSTFISYSRRDKEFALELARELKSAGYLVWLDQLDIPTGARWDDEVERALRESEIFLIVLTPASTASENVKDEIGYAIDHGKHMLPILMEECVVPLRLRRFQYVDFTKMEFSEGAKRVEQLLETLINEQSTPLVKINPEPEARKVPVKEGTSVPPLPIQNKSFRRKWIIGGVGIVALAAILGAIFMSRGFIVPSLTVEEQAMEILKLATHSWKQDVLDTFDNNEHQWPMEEQPTSDPKDSAEVSINGKYYVDTKTGDGDRYAGGWWLLSKIQTPEKFYLATDALCTSTPPGCVMALVWSTSKGNYLFDIYEDEKNYSLMVYDREITENGGFKDVIPKTTTHLILSQNVNRLSVINDGTYIWLYINDQFLNRAKNEYVSGGELGYYVRVFQNNAQVTFKLDNLELRSPEQ